MCMAELAYTADSIMHNRLTQPSQSDLVVRGPNERVNNQNQVATNHSAPATEFDETWVLECREAVAVMSLANWRVPVSPIAIADSHRGLMHRQKTSFGHLPGEWDCRYRRYNTENPLETFNKPVMSFSIFTISLSSYSVPSTRLHITWRPSTSLQPSICREKRF
jgi:hypothetical protein